MMTRQVILLACAFCLPALSADRAFADAPAVASAPEQSVKAGPIEVTVTLNRSTLNVAQSLVVNLTVRAPIGVRVTLPPEDAKLDGFSVSSVLNEPLLTVPAKEGEQQVIVRRFTLAPFLPGEYEVPPMEIRWQKSEKESGVARTAAVRVTVESLLPEKASADAKSLDPGTIRGEYLLPAPSGNTGLATGIAIGFGAAAALGGGLWFVNRRRAPKDDIAGLISRVDSLRAQSQGEPSTESLHQLASALRGGLVSRLDLGTNSQSTAELIGALSRKPDWAERDVNLVGEVLEMLDAARFGGTALSVDRFRSLADSVASILDKLRSMPPRLVQTEAAP